MINPTSLKWLREKLQKTQLWVAISLPETSIERCFPSTVPNISKLCESFSRRWYFLRDWQFTGKMIEDIWLQFCFHIVWVIWWHMIFIIITIFNYGNQLKSVNRRSTNYKGGGGQKMLRETLMCQRGLIHVIFGIERTIVNKLFVHIPRSSFTILPQNCSK